MPSCFAPDCNHSEEYSSCKFHRFPKDKTQRKKWERAIRWEDRTADAVSDRICSCHFVHEDFSLLPSIFQRNANKRFTFTSPEKSNRRKRLCDITNAISNGHDDSESSSAVTNAASNGHADSESSSVVAVKQYAFSSTFHESEKYFFEREIEKLKEEIRRLTTQTFGFFSIGNNNVKCLFYTGLHVEVFEILEKLCSTITFQYYNNKRVEKIVVKDQILLTLIKLRLNLAYNDLGWRFGVSDSTAFRIVCTFLPVLHKIVFQSVMNEILSQRKNASSLPVAFGSYKSCRVVIDCTKMRCQIPKKMDHQKSTWSPYKHYNTLKALVGVAPNAAVVYCSRCYPGCTSDKEIVQHCGIMKHLVTGDMVMADKGFVIADILPPGTSVNIPPFLSSPQFTPSQKAKTRSIARARIHVERANARLKNFKIVEYFPKSLFARASMIVQTCAGLINFQNPLLPEIKQHFDSVP